jgi:hypothetical protein
MNTKDFPKTSLESISDHCVSDLTTDRKSDA